MAVTGELTFELVTPEGLKFAEQCYEIQLPTPEGLIGVFPRHVPLVSLAVSGVVSVRLREDDPDTALDHFAVAGGIIEVEGSRVRLLADTAEHADDIDELQAQEALEHAKELQETAKDHVALTDATALIERNLARLRVTELRKHKRKNS